MCLQSSALFYFQDVNINNSFPVKIGRSHFYWVNRQHTKQSVSILRHSPSQTLMLWAVRSNCLFSNQNNHCDSMIFPSSLSLTNRKMCREKVENDPTLSENGYISSLLDHCFFRCSYWTGMQHCSTQNIHQKKNAISPQRSLFCACRGVT